MEIVLVVVGKCVTYAVCGLSVTRLGPGCRTYNSS